MPVIIQQGTNKMFVQPGVVAGVSDEQNKEIMENQKEAFKGDDLLIMLLDSDTV